MSGRLSLLPRDASRPIEGQTSISGLGATYFLSPQVRTCLIRADVFEEALVHQALHDRIIDTSHANHQEQYSQLAFVHQALHDRTTDASHASLQDQYSLST